MKLKIRDINLEMKSNLNHKQIIENSSRIVIKIGSVLVTNEDDGTIKKSWLKCLAEDINELINIRNKEVIIVSSGSISLGRKYFELSLKANKSKFKIEQKQAAASIGQIELINTFYNSFKDKGINISQILLSPFDTEDRRAHLNARATLNTLLQNNIVPIINENDTVTTQEIRFGDNDRLAARVAQMVGADLLILLSTIDGLYTDDPKMNKQAKHIPVVEKIDDRHLEMGKDVRYGISTGGMRSKIQAAIIAVNSGTNMIIANGTCNNPLNRLINDIDVKSTCFLTKEKPMSARKKWILSHLEHQASVIIDAGAVHALKNGKSLLPVGIKEIRGNFLRGDIIEILDENNNVIAIGISSYNSEDGNKIKGKNSKEIEEITGFSGREEFIHRTNLALR